MEKENKDNEGKNILEKHRRWLIPFLCLIVIFQAVALASGPRPLKVASEPSIPTPALQEVQESASVLAFAPSGISLRKGEIANIDLYLTPKRDLRLDGVDVVLGFDPEVVEVTQVTTPKVFSHVTQKKEEKEEGRIYVTFLEEAEAGFLAREPIKLVTLTIRGKKVGEGDFTVITAEEGPTTVIAENKTSQKLAFDKGSLKVIVY